MKNLKAENPCNKTLFRWGGGYAFTMAEILLSLTIIGVVAAITLPSLTGNINERTWNTQRKALYARFSQAIALMPALNGYGTLTEDESGSVTEDTAAETFVTAGLSKVLKINNICDANNMDDCGLPTQYIRQDNAEKTDWPTTMDSLVELSGCGFGSIQNTKAAAFETANGEAIALYYNPTCISDLVQLSGTNWVQTQRRVCANLIYDLNGNKGPNTIGKDIGVITILDPIDPQVVAPVFATRDSQISSASVGATCTAFDTEYRAPNFNELISLYFNKHLFGFAENSYYYQAGDGWYMAFNTGSALKGSGGNRTRCVKR